MAYDWADPSSYRSPVTGTDGATPDDPTGGPGHTGSRDHSHWEHLHFPGIPWTRMLFIGLVAFGLWFLLDAPSLQRSAQVSPVGTRRTVSLDVVGPVAALSRALGLSHVVGWTDEALGRVPGGGPALSHAKPQHHLPPLPVPPPAGATTTTTTLPALNTQPTAADPLRLLVVGDSVGLDLGQALVATLATTGQVTSVLDGRVDTGLSRPDYFNWPAELRIDLANQQPQLVVVMMGANDPQGLVEGTTSIPYGSPGWNAAYGRRVGAFLDEANVAGAHVLWVGMPPMASPQLNGEVQNINAIDRAEVAARSPGATWLSSTRVLGDPQGNYTAFLPNASGAEINIRTPDGIHLTPGGASLLAAAVESAMRTDLHIQLNP